MNDISEIPQEPTDAMVVAATALRVIDMLNSMIIKGLTHDDASYGELFGATTFLTSVLDGKCENPVEMAGGFVAACQIIDKSLLDEIDRCQNFLAEQIKKAGLAEGRALLAEQHERWYLRLRDPVAVCDPVVHVDNDRYVSGDELDEIMEDMDGETEDVSDFQIPIQ